MPMDIYSRETKDAARIAKVLTEDEARRISSNIVAAHFSEFSDRHFLYQQPFDPMGHHPRTFFSWFYVIYFALLK